ncbi:mucin-3A-like [Sitodiplosis mosellana]|uniref:mucin-3A-like n=1 Tax=Sitodiplosis mosellana TaxID=263140 RepID=UPI002443B26E|nr:mucin-3A-like [Sitodiplosis mosellana]
MTKKKNEQRHIQNRAWEKDRRDRLNTTFEKLAKLLPEYRPKVTFSKIEILHKTIVYIEDLRKKLRDVLSTQNESIFKTQDELEASLKALVSQNNDLVELLQKSNIKVPHFVEPKFLSFIVSVHGAERSDEEEKSDKDASKSATSNELNQNQPQTKSNVKPKEVIQNPVQINKELNGTKTTNSSESSDSKSLPKTQLNISPVLNEVQSFGSVDLIPVSSDSSRPEFKMHEQPVKNFVEITPLLNNQNEKLSLQSEKSIDLPKRKEPSSIQESKIEKRSSDVSVILNMAQSSDSKITKAEKSNENISEKQAVEKPKNKPKASPNEAQASSHCDKKSTAKKQNVQERKTNPPNVQTTNIVQTESAKVSKPTTVMPVCSVTEQNKATISDTINPNTNAGTISGMNSGKKVEHLMLPKDLSVNISNEKDLSDEIFGNFPLPQTPNESNPNALSPTAAFLLSFPVVSTVSSSKPTETDNSYSEGTNLLRLEEKPNQPKDHSLFESISSILNDLNDVSDSSKNITNIDHSNGTQFPYCTNKNRSVTSADEHDKPNVLSNVGANRTKSSQKNLNINNLLSTDRMRSSHSGRVESAKPSNIVMKKPPIPECSTSTMQSNSLLSDRTNYIPSRTFENVPTSTDNTSDFYVSLSTLGLPLKSAATLASTPINPSSHFNFQISSLAQPRNLIDSRPLIADTPFTFSLTKCSDTMTNTTSSTAKAITQQQMDHQTVVHRMDKAQKKSSPTKHLVNDRFVVPAEPTIASLNRCNSFNPFAFDNPPMLSSSSSIALGSLTTVSSNCSSIGTPFTFTLTPTFSSISASTPLLSNHDPLFSSSFDMPIMRSTSALSKNPNPKKDKPSVPFGENKDQTQLSIGKSNKNYAVPSTSKPSKNLVNWMTSSVNKPTQELHLDFMPSTAEEPSAWSPNRMAVDNTNLISSSALPMLQGDLALNTISNSCNPPVNKFDIDSKKLSQRTNSNNHNNQKYSPSKVVTNRKSEHHIQPDRSGKGGKSDKNLHTFKNHHQSVRMNEPNPITNNFHSVSQLLDQERQTANKNSCYIPSEGKLLLKDISSSSSGGGGSGVGNSAVIKQKLYSKYEPEPNNQLVENKFPTNACNVVGSSDIMANECDRDLFGGYFFGQPKRLKLNYHSSSEFLGNQGYASTYENSTANDILAPYTNYQTFDSECNNAASSACINNLSNQTYTYQYTQPQSYNHQPQQQQPQSACDPIDSTNYFQAPASLPSYKPSHFNEMVRNNSKASTQQSFLHHQITTTTTTTATVAKTNDSITANAKLFACPSSSSAAPNISTQLPMSSTNRNPSACSSKTIHYPSHTNINNLPLNQAWNDSFSWMPYTNSIEKPYNNNLFNSNSDSSNNNKTSLTTNNISGSNNNTIPNFNLTTIFPDYNKS